MKQHSAATLTEFFAGVRLVTEQLGTGLWWRGQADASWHLMPKVHRLSPVHGHAYEANIAAAFAKRAPTRHDRCPPPGDLTRWLFLMQHYGLPTRLLDWTESPLFALFFAVRELEYAKLDAAVWALKPEALNRSQGVEPTLLQPGHQEVKALVDEAYAEWSSNTPRAFAIVSEEIDIRMLVQLSTFTIHAAGHALEGLSGADAALARLVIPAAAKPQLMADLAQSGVRASTLFPDLTHLAEELQQERYPD